MDELGISDVDDISEPSDSASLPAPTSGTTRPTSQPPAPPTSSGGGPNDDWDASVMSDITTPRPGILKKFSNVSHLFKQNKKISSYTP